MTTLNQLTKDEFTQLLDEYFAPPIKRTRMTEAEIKDLAERLNEKINVPIINESREKKILIKIILKIDRFLYDNLPNEFYELIRSIDKGIDDNEARRLIIRLSKLANEHINIPYIPESMEFIAIRFVIGIVINAARRHWNLDRAKSELANVEINDSEYSTDAQLESLIQ